jgi:hypothetical protein
MLSCDVSYDGINIHLEYTESNGMERFWEESRRAIFKIFSGIFPEVMKKSTNNLSKD